jgi:glycosyltransferase 2 family protein
MWRRCDHPPDRALVASAWQGRRRAHLPFWLVLRALPIAYLGNAALPARLGEAARAGVIARAAHRTFGAVLGSVLLERLIDLVPLAVLVLAASVFAPVPALVVTVAAVTISIGIAGGLVLVILGKRLGQAVLAAPVGLRQRAMSSRRHLLVGALHAGAGVILSAGGLSLLVWMLEAGVYLAAGPSLGISLPVGTAVIIGAARVLATALPAAPGYVGTYDLAAAAVGVALGLDPATAVALAAVAHVVALPSVAIAGAGALVFETLSGRSVRFFDAGADRPDA